jgi:hypothetical protein
MAFQHAKDIMHVEAPSPTTVQKNVLKKRFHGVSHYYLKIDVVWEMGM